MDTAPSSAAELALLERVRARCAALLERFPGDRVARDLLTLCERVASAYRATPEQEQEAMQSLWHHGPPSAPPEPAD